jgi:hypothetical protein
MAKRKTIDIAKIKEKARGRSVQGVRVSDQRQKRPGQIDRHGVQFWRLVPAGFLRPNPYRIFLTGNIGGK